MNVPLPIGLDPRTKTAFDTLIAAWQAQFGKLLGSWVFKGSMTAVQPRCHLVKTAAQAITTAQATDLTWPVIGQDLPAGAAMETQFDNGRPFGGTFLKLADSTALVPPIGGLYLVIATVSWEANATGSRRVTIRSDVGASAVTYGAATVQQSGGHAAGTSTIQQACAVIRVPATPGIRDAIYIQVVQTSGGNLNVNADSHVQIVKIS